MNTQSYLNAKKGGISPLYDTLLRSGIVFHPHEGIEYEYHYRWIISAYSALYFKRLLNCRLFILKLKRFSNYAKVISEILELIS